MSNLAHPVADSFAIGRSLSDAFAAVRVHIGPLWLGGLLLTVSDGCGANVPGDLPAMPGADDGDANAVVLPGWLARVAAANDAPAGGEWMAWVLAVVVAVAVAAFFVAALLFCLNCWIQTGSIRLHENVIVRGDDHLGALFSGRDRFLDMVGWKLLSGLCISGATLVAAWPGVLLAYAGWATQRNTLWNGGIGFAVILGLPAAVYVGLGVFLGDRAVVLEGRRPVEALRRAWSIARGNRFPLLLFAFVCMLVQLASVLGLVLCFVGALATVPLGRAVTELAKTEGFLIATRGLREAQGFHLWQRLAHEQALAERVARGGAGYPVSPAPGAASAPPPGGPSPSVGPSHASEAPPADQETSPRAGYVPVPPPRRPPGSGEA